MDVMQTPERLRLLFFLGIIPVTLVLFAGCDRRTVWDELPQHPPPEEYVVKGRLIVQLPEAANEVLLIEGVDGGVQYAITTHTRAGTLLFSGEEFLDVLNSVSEEKTFWKRLLNVSGAGGIVWVGIGLLGQVLFAGRMIVQWLRSEKEKRSVVPVVFWWLSLGGATLLLLYFLWRRDVIGVLGQSIGWLIYVRNLWLIHKRGGQPPVE